MTEDKAKSLVLAGVGAAGVLSSLEHIAKGQRPALATWVGVAVSGVVLLVIAETAPALAAGLAALLLVGALLTNGAAVGAIVSKSTGH